MKVLGFVTVLAILVWVTVHFPFLWEISVAGILGGVWWFFFRQPPQDKS